MTFIPAYTTNAMTSDFLLLIPHGLVVPFPDSCRTVFTFRSWLDLLVVEQAFWISFLSFEKHLESSLDHTPNFCRNLVIVRSTNMCLRESLTPVFYGDLVYKLRRVKDTPNFISSGSKIVKCVRRQYDPLIIERTIGLCLARLQPCTNLS